MMIQKPVIRALTLFVLWGASVLLVCCAGQTARLADRGVSVSERNEYLQQNGYVISKDLQKAFMEGSVAEGMTRDMVLHLFGSPDRTGEKDSVWEYVDGKGRDVTGIRFKGEKVVQVYGDAMGRYTKSRK